MFMNVLAKENNPWARFEDQISEWKKVTSKEIERQLDIAGKENLLLQSMLGDVMSSTRGTYLKAMEEVESILRKAAEAALPDRKDGESGRYAIALKKTTEEAHTMDKSRCTGCENNFYNGNNDKGIAECWSLKTATLMMKKQVGMNDVPPWNHTPVEVPSCYHINGYWFVEPERTT